MNEEERRRKIILDAGSALIRQLECTRNTLLLSLSNGSKVTDEQIDGFRHGAEELTRSSASIERHCAGRAVESEE